MHSPPWETIGEAVTRWSVMRPSSPIAHRRWKNISKRTGSIFSFLLFIRRSLSSIQHSKLKINLADFHHEIEVLVDRHLKPRRHQRGRERQLDHRRPPDARAGTEERIVVNVGVDELPIGAGEKNLPLAFFGGGGAARPAPRRVSARRCAA